MIPSCPMLGAVGDLSMRIRAPVEAAVVSASDPPPCVPGHRSVTRRMRAALLVSLLLVTTTFADDLIVRQRASAGLSGPSPGEETVYLSGQTIVTDNPA